MKIGKLPEAVLKRSVLKQIHTSRPEILVGAGIGEDCAVIEAGEDEVFVLSTDPITGTATDIGNLAIQINLNDLASSGAEPVGVLVTMLLPPETEEPQIREILGQMEEQCARFSVQIMGGHTEVTPVVNQPLLSITAVGKVKKERLLLTGGAKSGDDIVITKWIALEGTSILAKEHAEELLTRFPSDLVTEAQRFDRYLSVLPEAAVAGKTGVHAMHDVTEGGIFGALWEMAEASGVGLEIDSRSIPVRQETIEICEFFGLNPYGLISSGSMLIATPDGTGLVRALEREGIPAAIVGKATEGNDRILRNGEEIRYLEPPKTDEIYRIGER